MWSDYLLFILLIICVVTDIRERKIYNSILYPILCASWILHLVVDGTSGLIGSLQGTVVGLGILLIPFFLGGMGAGDVKLLSVIGAIKGVQFVLMASLYMAFAGGIMAIIVLLFRKGTKARIMQAMYIVHGLTNGVKLPLPNEKEGLKTVFPYGIAIAAGAIFQTFRPGGLFL